MAPVTQYVFAEMLVISEYFAAGSHEWLPYSVIPTLLKTDLQTTIYRFAKSSRYMVIIVPVSVDVKAEIVNISEIAPGFTR